MVTDKAVQQQLIAKGEAQGYITYDDILALVPSAENNLESVEELLEELGQAGIVILPNAPAPGAAIEAEADEPDPEALEAIEAPTDEELEELGPLDFDLIDDSGYQQAIDTDDVVGLYLKEAGRVPLLTAEEEVSLAKRMEAGQLAQEQLDEYADSLPADDRLDLQ